MIGEEGFYYSVQIEEMQRLLNEIKKTADSLYTIVLSEEEQKERAEILSCFNSRVLEMANGTLKNLEGYRQFRWQELFDEGEDADGRID